MHIRQMFLLYIFTSARKENVLYLMQSMVAAVHSYHKLGFLI
jgi:hypothetical protein